MDFLGDIAEIMAAKLFKAGYTAFIIPYASARSCIEMTMIAYLNVAHRRIKPKPRTVFDGHYAVPSHHQAAVDEILRKARCGESFRSHMSTQLSKEFYDDDMLSDFGVHHFHLSLQPHPKNPAFLARTGKLLYAIVTEDSFYAIGIFDHSSWSKKDVLEKINQEFPYFLKRYKCDVLLYLTYTPTDAERGGSRNSNLNTYTKLSDGSIIGPPGGGISAGGLSSNVADQVMYFRRFSRHLERSFIGSHARILEDREGFYIRTKSRTTSKIYLPIIDLV